MYQCVTYQAILFQDHSELFEPAAVCSYCAGRGKLWSIVGGGMITCRLCHGLHIQEAPWPLEPHNRILIPNDWWVRQYASTEGDSLVFMNFVEQDCEAHPGMLVRNVIIGGAKQADLIDGATDVPDMLVRNVIIGRAKQADLIAGATDVP